MMKNRNLIYIILLLCLSCGRNQNHFLDIYFLDMAGGASTLVVTPLKESILIDTGSLLPEKRDVDRIYQATQLAGLDHIDHLITTHFHSDHFGAILPLSKKIPIKNYYDKGVLPPEQDSEWFKKLYPLYQQATKGETKTLYAGDELPLLSSNQKHIPPVRLKCIAAQGKIDGLDTDINAPVSGFEMKKPDKSDNVNSIALLLTFGDFRFFAGGDITWNLEHHLAYPVNRIGKVDLFQVTHHGLDQSNNPLLLKAIQPVVCIALNGPQKGIQSRTFNTIRELKSVQALYQLHFNTQNGEKGNTESRFIANGESTEGQFIRVQVYANAGHYTVSVGNRQAKDRFEISKNRRKGL